MGRRGNFTKKLWEVKKPLKYSKKQTMFSYSTLKEMKGIIMG